MVCGTPGTPGYPGKQEVSRAARVPLFPKTDRALTQPFNTPLRGAPFSAPSMLPRARLGPELDLRPQRVSCPRPRPRPRPGSASLGPALRAPRSRPALYLWGGGWGGWGLGRADDSLKASKLPAGQRGRTATCPGVGADSSTGPHPQPCPLPTQSCSLNIMYLRR